MFEKEKKSKRDNYIEEILKYVKFSFAHDEIEAELSAHLDDAREYFVEAGLSEEGAEDRAIQNMGDAEEIGKALNKEHKPWIGRLHILSKWILGILIFAVVTSIFASDFHKAYQFYLPGYFDEAIEEHILTIRRGYDASDIKYIGEGEIDKSFVIDGVTYTFDKAILFKDVVTDSPNNREIHIFVTVERSDMKFVDKQTLLTEYWDWDTPMEDVPFVITEASDPSMQALWHTRKVDEVHRKNGIFVVNVSAVNFNEKQLNVKFGSFEESYDFVIPMSIFEEGGEGDD